MPSRLLGVLLVLCLAWPRPARGVDPRLEWRTLESEHFEIHFPDGGYEVALRTARYLEGAYGLLVPRLRHAPWTKTQVVLTDDVDTANGSATSIPFPRVHAYMFPPDSRSVLNNYDDYLWLLLAHEYVHVLHLGTVGGVPDLANRVVGHLLGPNFLQPHWIIEGIATYYESSLTGEGRNHSALADMYLRAQVHDAGALWPVSEVSGNPVDWPGATFWYLYGGRVWDWVVARRGDAAPSRVSHDYGGRLLPFAVNASSDEAVGLRFADAYRGWAADETTRLRRQLAEVRSEGERRGVRLTRFGRQVTSPRWAPDGRSVLAYVANGEAFPAIRRIAVPRTAPAGLDESEVVRREAGGGRFDLDASGRIVVYARSDYFEQAQVYDDLWAVSTEGGPAVRLTYGMRARDPALSADGTRLAFVAGRRGEMAVYVAALSVHPRRAGAPPVVRLGVPRRVFHEAGAQVDGPALSPDGRRLAVAVHRRGGGREIALVDLTDVALPAPSLLAQSGGALRVGPAAAPFLRPDVPGPSEAEVRARLGWVTDDGAQAADPAFGPSGRVVYFTSDRGGIYDLYARDLADGAPTGPLWRVTRTPTGAFEPAPSPDGARLAYVDYGSEGYDLALLDVDRASWTEAGAAPAARPAPSYPKRAQVYPVRAYRPWETLRPYYWLPLVSYDGQNVQLGATTSGADVVGLHAWSATGWWDVAWAQPGYRASYSYGAAYPALSLSSSRTVVGGAVQRGNQLFAYEEVSWQGTAAATFFWPHLDRSQSLGVSLGVDHRTPLTAVAPPDPGLPGPAPPAAGTATRMGLSWAGSTAHRFAESISPQEGVSARASAVASTHFLGGDYDWLRITAGATGYLEVPFLRLHVLALNLEGGAGFGEFGGRPLFALGGLTFDDPLRALYGGQSLRGTTLRGYPPYAFVGDAYGLANLEYRLPILTPQRGVSTLPFFLRRITGAVFADAGVVGPSALELSAADVKVGVGAELRFELELGYNLGVQLRAGFAQGLMAGGISQPYLGFGGTF